MSGIRLVLGLDLQLGILGGGMVIHYEKIYGIEGYNLKKIEAVMKRLYGDGSSLSSDERRDLADILCVLLNSDVFVELTDYTTI